MSTKLIILASLWIITTSLQYIILTIKVNKLAENCFFCLKGVNIIAEQTADNTGIILKLIERTGLEPKEADEAIKNFKKFANNYKNNID